MFDLRVLLVIQSVGDGVENQRVLRSSRQKLQGILVDGGGARRRSELCRGTFEQGSKPCNELATRPGMDEGAGMELLLIEIYFSKACGTIVFKAVVHIMCVFVKYKHVNINCIYMKRLPIDSEPIF